MKENTSASLFPKEQVIESLKTIVCQAESESNDQKPYHVYR